MHFNLRTPLSLCVLCLILASSRSMAEKRVPAKTDTAQLEEARSNLHPQLSSDQQFEKFKKANLLTCETLLKHKSLDTRSKDQEAYADQLLLMTARLIRIDAGKTVLDCMNPYYLKNKETLDKRLKEWPAQESLYVDAKKALESEWKNLKDSPIPEE